MLDGVGVGGCEVSRCSPPLRASSGTGPGNEKKNCRRTWMNESGVTT